MDRFEAGPARLPWSFRGGPNTEIGRTVQAMAERARASTTRIGGQSAEGLLTRAILANPLISNEQIMAMSRMRPAGVASTPRAIERTLREIPDARSQPNHQFTVDLLHAVTGIDRETISRNGPDLGMTGSAERGAVLPWNWGRPFLWRPDNDREALSTALHDFTDTMATAGVRGVQQAIWGSEDRAGSAARSWINGVPRQFLEPTAQR
ncbi:MAG TPA: hypothetical protein VIG99_12670 [Myxococcaceae bacterium]